MPDQDFGLYPDGLTAGTEVSSTYEGRHISVYESELLHVNNGTGFPIKGQPVVFGTVAGAHGVGVIINITPTAVTDICVIDTEGIYNLSVTASDDLGNSLVTGGDPLYINTTTCVISKIRNNATQIPFGYALGQATGDGTALVIAVKVHWDPRSHWLEDMEYLYFGDLMDVSLRWDGTNLVMLPLVDDTGAFIIGNAAGTLCMDFRIYGGTVNSFLFYDNDLGTLDLENVVLAPSDRALSVAVTMALPQGEGLTGFFEATLTGLQAGLTYGLYSWFTLGGTFVATGTVTTPLDTGIYTGGADLTAARLIFGAQHMAILDSVPLSYYPWRINVSAGAGSITALIQAGNIQSVGYIAAITETADPIGYIPLAFIAGIAAAQPCYVRVYTGTA